MAGGFTRGIFLYCIQDAEFGGLLTFGIGSQKL